MTAHAHRDNTIVVGFEESPQGFAALHWAAAEAHARGSRLRIVVAWNPSPATPWNVPEIAEWRARAAGEAERAASAARDGVGGGLDIEAVSVEGSPSAVLREESHSAELLVIGSAGHVGLGGFLVGSVSRRLMHHTRCPLVILGPNAQADATRRIVLSSTLDPDGEVFDWIARWEARRHTPIHVVASFELTAGLGELAVTPEKSQIKAAVRRANDEWVQRLRRAINGATSLITSSVVEDEVLHALELLSQAGDLVVVPPGCEHSVPVARGECPIAVVPSGPVASTRTAPHAINPAYAPAGAGARGR